jgi:hypothetical protein
MEDIMCCRFLIHIRNHEKHSGEGTKLHELQTDFLCGTSSMWRHFDFCGRPGQKWWLSLKGWISHIIHYQWERKTKFPFLFCHKLGISLVQVYHAGHGMCIIYVIQIWCNHKSADNTIECSCMLHNFVRLQGGRSQLYTLEYVRNISNILVDLLVNLGQLSNQWCYEGFLHEYSHMFKTIISWTFNCL